MKHLFLFALALSVATLISAQPARHEAMRRAPQAAPLQRVITKQPSGTLHTNLIASCVGFEKFYLSNFRISSVINYRSAQVVEADNGTVYIQNPIPSFPADTWVKAERAGGDTLVVAAQEIYDYQNEKYQICRMKYTGDEAHAMPNYEMDKENPAVTYLWKDGVLRSTSDFDDLYTQAIGVCKVKTGQWFEYAATHVEIAPQTDTPTPLPEGVEAEPFIVRYVDHQRFLVPEEFEMTTEYDTVYVAFSGNDIYVQPCPELNVKGWVKGSIEGDKVTFPSRQYLGFDEERGIHYYFLTGNEHRYTDEPFAEYYNHFFRDFDVTDQLVASIDADTRTISSDQVFAVFSGDRSCSDLYGDLYGYPFSEAHPYSCAFYGFTFFKYEERPASLRCPDFITYTDYMDNPYYENIRLSFYIYPETVEGNYLDKNRMYYEVFVDDPEDPYEFDASSYLLINNDFSYIPFQLDDAYDIRCFGVQHVLYVYFTGFDRIGVRSFFEAKDGQEYYSPICWYDVETGQSYNSVPSLTPATGTTSTEFFDLAGRRIGASAKGLVLRSERTPDGQHRFVKTIRK